MMIKFYSDHIKKEFTGSIHSPVKNRDISECPNRIIYHKVTQASYLNQIGPLSIKYVFNGKERYDFDRNRVIVDDSSYLILNNQRCYCNFIDSEDDVESLTIFFNKDFVSEVMASLVTPDDKLLEDPHLTYDQPVLFFEKLYPHDNIITPRLHHLRKMIMNGLGTQIALEEYFCDLLEGMLQVHRNIYQEIEKLPPVRYSTRVEIYRRLHRAKDFIDSNFKENIGLMEMADIASLSRYHFLRLFKTAFEETPHQYLIRKRLDAAQNLLLSTNMSITQICFEVGFESLSSINRLFSQHVGQSPRNFRRGNFKFEAQQFPLADNTMS